jgi:hypothetical protein
MDPYKTDTDEFQQWFWVCWGWKQDPNESGYTCHAQSGSVQDWYWYFSAMVVHWIYGNGQKLPENGQHASLSVWAGPIPHCFGVLTAIQLSNICIWDHSPHHFLVFGRKLVNFGRKIKVDSVSETRESRAHVDSLGFCWSKVKTLSVTSICVSASIVQRILVFFLTKTKRFLLFLTWNWRGM